jgi:hypothetical protein
MKIKRSELRQLIAEMAGHRYKKYGPGTMGYSDLTPIRGDHLGRAEAGEYRQRLSIPEPEVKISNNASNALYAFNYSWREHGKTMEALEKMYGHVTGYSLNTGAVYFYDMETGKETEMNIHEMLK